LANQLKIESYFLENLSNVAEQLILFAKDTRIWIFEAEMGAGKTTLIKSICKQLGIVDEVTSPTYSIVNEYLGPKGKVYHFDFYRINSEIEALDIGIDEYFASESYNLIEWPERITNLIPSKHLKISIQTLSPTERSLIATLHQ
jgi:tRNA threonylcarbamoyladenosine biosynthesis protein TsaE